MTITLPLTNQTVADYRILYRVGFGAGTGAGDNQAVSAGNWSIFPLQRRGTNQHGLYLKYFERVSLPQVGRAAFACRYGAFDDVTVDNDDLAKFNNCDIRIQASPTGTAAWRTVYWGTVDYVEDVGSPGATTPRGEKVFHCLDGLYRAQRWPLDRHGYYASGGSNWGIASGGHALGNPGYNWAIHHDSVLAGNRGISQWLSPAGVSVYYHTPPGAGTTWTDQQAVEHALGASKPPGEPLFTLAGATDLLGSANPWEVKPGDSVLDLLLRILKRERGRGLVYVDWDDDSSNPTGPLTVKLTVAAQLAADVTYISAFDSGATTIALGATSRGTTTTVDLSGDHRCVDHSLEIGDPDQFRLDYLETEGEPIEVLASLSYIDGQLGTGSNVDGRCLMRGWSAADQATYVALTTTTRQEHVYNSVFQLHRLNPAGSLVLGDGNGGEQSSADYRCTAAGRIVTPAQATAAEQLDPAVVCPVSPLLLQILPDLPLYEAYLYSGASVARKDGAAETVNPARRKMVCYVRVASGKYLDADQTSTGSVHMSVDGDAVWVVHSGDEGNGTRFFSASSPSNLSFAYTYQSLVLTVGLRLPHRVRLASGDPNTARRRGKIHIPGAHLWLAHPGAIYDLNAGAAGSGGFSPRRAALGATSSAPGVLRDDRAALARLHALSWAWYGTATTRRSASWALKACGFLPTFSAYEGSVITGTPLALAYPTVGQVITTLTANGDAVDLNTPVTRVHYDAERAVTTWSTEWHELETGH